jgi:hypothetical protein
MSDNGCISFGGSCQRKLSVVEKGQLDLPTEGFPEAFASSNSQTRCHWARSCRSSAATKRESEIRGPTRGGALAAISDISWLEKHDPSLLECPLSPLRPITQQHSTTDAAKANARWNTILRGTMIACGHGRGGGDAQQA